MRGRLLLTCCASGIERRKELQRWNVRVRGTEPGLAGWFPMNEGTGHLLKDRLDPSRFITLHEAGKSLWVAEPGPPMGEKAPQPEH